MGCPKVDVAIRIDVTYRGKLIVKDSVGLLGVLLHPYREFPIKLGEIVERLMDDLETDAFMAIEKMDKEDD